MNNFPGRRLFLRGAMLAPVLVAAINPVNAQEPPRFVLTIKNHRFEPAELTIPANTKVALVVRNLDATPEEFESVSLRREKVIPGNSEGLVYIGPLAPGRYDFFGEFNPKTAQGVIVVK